MRSEILLLLVDDDATIAAILKEALSDGGFDVVTAHNGKEALAVMEEKIVSLRGVITDVNLGEGPDGWDIARHARELSAHIPVVYMSGASSHEWASHGVPNSVIIQKPFANAQIVTAISELINTHDAHH